MDRQEAIGLGMAVLVAASAITAKPASGQPVRTDPVPAAEDTLQGLRRCLGPISVHHDYCAAKYPLTVAAQHCTLVRRWMLVGTKTWGYANRLEGCDYFKSPR